MGNERRPFGCEKSKESTQTDGLTKQYCVSHMCKHAARTTDDKNSWIEYFLYDTDEDDIVFPALSALVRGDGRRQEGVCDLKPGNPTCHPKQPSLLWIRT